MLPLPVLILIGVVLSILIGLGSYQFYFKEWNSCDWGYGCPTPSTPSAPTPSGPAPAPCDVNQRIKGGVCVACGEGYINPAGDDPAEFTDTFCKQCAENYHVSGRTCVKCGTQYTHDAGDVVTAGNTKCGKCAKDHRVLGESCVTCDIGAGSEGAYRDAGDDIYGSDTACINYLKRGKPIKTERCYYAEGTGSAWACTKSMYWQTDAEFQGSFPGGWTNDLKCKYNEEIHTNDENWKKSCPGGDPDVMYSYTIPQEWKDMKDAE